MPGVHSTQGGSVGVPVSCRLLRRLAWGRSRSSPQLPPAALQGRIEPPSVSGRRWACDGGCRAPRPAARPMAWQGGVRAPLLLSPTAARLHSTPVRSPSFSLCIEGWGFAGLALLLALAHSTRLGKGPRLGDSQGGEGSRVRAPPPLRSGCRPQLCFAAGSMSTAWTHPQWLCSHLVQRNPGFLEFSHSFWHFLDTSQCVLKCSVTDGVTDTSPFIIV